MASIATNTEEKLQKIKYGGATDKFPFKMTRLKAIAPFTDKGQVGDVFKTLVELQGEHGMTYGGVLPATATTTLLAPVIGMSLQSTISAYQFWGRTKVEVSHYETAKSAGDAAFASAEKIRVDALQTGMEFRHELSLLRGQLGLFKVQGNSSGTLTITQASWNGPTAVRLVGAVLEAWTAQTASATQHDGDLTVTGVDTSARTITVSGTSTAVVANDWLYFKGARTASTWNEMPGFCQLANTSSGNLQGINVGTYPWYKPVQLTSFGRPSFAAIQTALENMIGRHALVDEADKDMKRRTTIWMHPTFFNLIAADLTSARVFDGSYSSEVGEMGVGRILFHGPTGVTELRIHELMPYGEMLAHGPQNLFRIGNYDIKFDQGPRGESDLWTRAADTTDYQMRAHYLQSTGLTAPGGMIYITGVTT